MAAVALLGLLLRAAPAQAAIALNSHATAGSSGGAAIVNGASQDTSGATLLTAFVSGYIGITDPITAVTDSRSNTWTPLTRAPATANVVGQWYYSIPTSTGAAHTFNVGNTNGYTSLYVQSWTGTKASLPFDQQNGGMGADNIAAGSITPTEDNELVLVGIALTSGTVSGISGGGFSAVLDQLATSGGNYQGGAVAYIVQTTAGATNPTFAAVGSNGSAAIASFKVSAGGGGATPTCGSGLLLRGVGCEVVH